MPAAPGILKVVFPTQAQQLPRVNKPLRSEQFSCKCQIYSFIRVSAINAAFCLADSFRAAAFVIVVVVVVIVSTAVSAEISAATLQSVWQEDMAGKLLL